MGHASFLMGPLFFTQYVATWGLPLGIAVCAMLAMTLPALRIRTGTSEPALLRLGPLIGLTAAVVAVIAAELYVPGFKIWHFATLMAVIVAVGIGLVARSRRTVAARGEAAARTTPLDEGVTARSWFAASLLGFVALFGAGILGVFLLDALEFTLTPTVQIAAVLAAIVVGDLTANLLLRFRARTYRAELRPRGVSTVLSRRRAVGVLALCGTVALAGFAIAVGEYRMTVIAACAPYRDLALSEAVDTVGLGMIGVTALTTTALGALGVLVAATRPAIASLEPARDRALRRLSTARTLCAVVGAQLVLAGDLVPGAVYAVRPTDPAQCLPSYGNTYVQPGWLPGADDAGALLTLTGLALTVSGCLGWAIATWRTSSRALTPFSAPPAQGAGTGDRAGQGIR
jgi:hypothetical protein